MRELIIKIVPLLIVVIYVLPRITMTP